MTEGDLVELARRLPVPAWPEERKEQTRTSLLAAASLEKRRRSPLVWLAPVAAAAAVVLVVLATRPHTPRARVVSGDPSVATTPAPPKVAVVTPPAPTGKNANTHVVANRDEEMLGANEQRPAHVEEVPLRPPARPAQREFEAGWRLLEAGHYTEAASSFEQAAADPNDPIREDALFERAVALERAGSPDARPAFDRFVAAYPDGLRAGEARVSAGNLLLTAHQLDDAADRFGAALEDADPKIRDAARKGLARIAQER